MPEKKPVIYIIDVTNRDGVQTANIGLAKLEKTMVNGYLNEMGVSQSEFGFPFTKHEINYLNANLELHELGYLSPIKLSGWMRAIKSDVELSMKNVPKLKHINLSISTSEQMIKYKFQEKYDRSGVIKSMREAVKAARGYNLTTIGVNAEDASRTDIKFLTEFALAAKEEGASRIRYCDTLGYDDPHSIYDRISQLVQTVKTPVELHCHNDLGLGVSASVSGAKACIDNGVDAYINTTINGIGERCGNADLVSVILSILKSGSFAGKYRLDSLIKLNMAWKICRYASYAFRIPIPINQPGVGSNAFAHESGIHADGALKDRRNYELYDHEELGRGEPEIVESGRQITLGEYSGIKGFYNVYGKMHIEFKNAAEATEILELTRYANVQKQKPLVNDELVFIAKYPEQARKILTLTP